ncbi:MAG: hypothetical protein HOL22_08375 [Euryarchaeota archaeon]|jgi:tRNA (adenine57-N1/adenine58-N1)-methyltransferase|nr:hypothetical protein [Euryarchaeota archaeon]MBT5595017.1 hypothetical protein [Euryarchaeota archaeon]MBT6640877.1 hypothetical protein [Euryarchaeota archaeon]MBT6845583.1 hypothetical protein [Euryarchaeota archaeon]MBT7063873.1 hypothetical protein [Euryarchaeota archaeon]
MNQAQWSAFLETDGKVHIVELVPGVRKIKGLGVLDAVETFSKIEMGEEVLVGQKILTRVPFRLPELSKGMLRRAQTISAKDAGFITSRLGIGPGDRILEAGIGSGGLSMYIARVLGNSGTHVTVEPRNEHAEVGLENLRRGREGWSEFPTHHHIEGCIEDVVNEIEKVSSEYDGIVLDLPEHTSAIEAVAPLLGIGGRIACYCPVTSQLEAAWIACEQAGFEIEWAGELIERQWGKASKGGVRPVNGPFGHTAFLLVAYRRN